MVVEKDRPERVNWHSANGSARQERSGGQVRRVIDQWRVATRWWAKEIRRDYYLLELDGGRLIELYREGEQWCVTGVAD